jgi:hypothetical protein
MGLGDNGMSPISYLSAGLVISRVEPAGPVSRRFVNSDNKGE